MGDGMDRRTAGVGRGGIIVSVAAESWELHECGNLQSQKRLMSA